ncbi:MAG TPA: DUF1844 domain-containing protein [Thermoanaerobaculia bacterium]|nr:DUF1844 domain-containing protein [Thermoanaerobaculia bacterium]
MGNEGKELKVTDKRMFTPEGELREEYRFLSEKSTATATPEPEPAPAPPPKAEEARRPSPPPQEDRRPAGFPETPAGFGPTFFDLVQMLMEPAVIYLGDMPLPDGQSAENLEMARLHIDMLDVLRQKTFGNLTAEESASLEDLLYRLRVRYVQKQKRG